MTPHAPSDGGIIPGTNARPCGCRVNCYETYSAHEPEIEWCPLHTSARALLAALKEMVEYSQCRQANTVERKMLAEYMEALGKKYRPLLASLGASPFVEEGDEARSAIRQAKGE